VAPSPVRIAFWVWVVSAVVSALFPVLLVFLRQQIIDTLRAQRPVNLAPDQYDDYVQRLITVYLITGVLFGLLYLLLAWQVRAGRNWARLAVTAFTVLGALYDLYAGSTPTTYIGLLIGAVAVVLVYLPGARGHFHRPTTVPETPA
jgi:hypothetical protein